MQRMLMIVHEASRTGAPVLALTLLRWLVRRADVGCEVLLLRDGPLAPEFEQLAPTYQAEKLNGRRTLIGRVVNRLLRLTPDYWLTRALRRMPSFSPQFVYGNSIVCLPALLSFDPPTGCRRVCAVHELTSVIDSFFSRDFVRENLPKLDCIVAGSRAVADNLVTVFDVDPAMICVVHAFIDVSPIAPRTKTEMRRLLGIPDGTTVIGGAGTPILRKGTDLLPDLAFALRQLDPMLRFRVVWLGGEPDDPLVAAFKQHAAELGVLDLLQFVDATATPNDYINLYDIFILPSREDPFPLVAVTAAFFEKPIVAFDGSGGMTELLADGAGFLVPHLDAAKFAEAVHLIIRDPGLASETGSKAGARLKEEYSSEAGCKLLFRAIFETVAPVH